MERPYIEKTWLCFSLLTSLKTNLRFDLPLQTKLTMYKSFFLSTLLYGSEFWSPSCAEPTKLESSEIKSTKWTCSGSSYRDRLLKCKLTPICSMLQFKDLTMLNRILTGKYDLNSMQLIQIQYNQRLRSSPKSILNLNRTKKSICEKIFLFSAVRLGNLVQTCASLNIFMDSYLFKINLKLFYLLLLMKRLIIIIFGVYSDFLGYIMPHEAIKSFTTTNTTTISLKNCTIDSFRSLVRQIIAQCTSAKLTFVRMCANASESSFLSEVFLDSSFIVLVAENHAPPMQEITREKLLLFSISKSH